MSQYSEHDWRWHERVPLWTVCRRCLITRRPGPLVGVYVYRLNGGVQWQEAEPECVDIHEQSASYSPTLFDLRNY